MSHSPYLRLRIRLALNYRIPNSVARDQPVRFEMSPRGRATIPFDSSLVFYANTLKCSAVKVFAVPSAARRQTNCIPAVSRQSANGKLRLRLVKWSRSVPARYLRHANSKIIRVAAKRAQSEPRRSADLAQARINPPTNTTPNARISRLRQRIGE